jgi:hypothetical protein
MRANDITCDNPRFFVHALHVNACIESCTLVACVCACTCVVCVECMHMRVHACKHTNAVPVACVKGFTRASVCVYASCVCIYTHIYNNMYACLCTC